MINYVWKCNKHGIFYVHVSLRLNTIYRSNWNIKALLQIIIHDCNYNAGIFKKKNGLHFSEEEELEMI
jgi:hypothetical protein